MAEIRPDFIKHVSEMPLTQPVQSRSGEMLCDSTSLSRPLGLVRVGVHHDVLRPRGRVELPREEFIGEQCVYVLEGRPHAAINGELHALFPDDVVVYPPGSCTGHALVNTTERDVRLLIIEERAPISVERFEAFLHWLEKEHPKRPQAEGLPESRLLELADEFEGGALAASHVLWESWRLRFVDQGLIRHSEPQPMAADPDERAV